MPIPSIVRKRKWSKINWTDFDKDMKDSKEWILKCKEMNVCSTLLTAAIQVHLDIQQQVKNYQLCRHYCAWVDKSTKKIIERKKLLSI